MDIIRSREFTGSQAWDALDIASMNGITTRLHWTDQPYKWHVNDGAEVWCVMMFFVAVSGFFIHSIRLWGLFSPIHLLSVLTIALLARAIWCARTGRIRQHQRIMANLFWLALVVTGVFTFFPGRIMFVVVSG